MYCMSPPPDELPYTNSLFLIESMFDLFKKKQKKNLPELTDIDNLPLKVGDHVMSQRYDLGECELLLEEEEYFYRSLETDKRVSWLRMIDAATERQKVKKIFL